MYNMTLNKTNIHLRFYRYISWDSWILPKHNEINNETFTNYDISNLVCFVNSTNPEWFFETHVRYGTRLCWIWNLNCNSNLKIRNETYSNLITSIIYYCSKGLTFGYSNMQATLWIQTIWYYLQFQCKYTVFSCLL